VQEAFARLIVRWDRVSQYDLSGAWIRSVTVRLSVRSRQRTRRFELLSDDVLVHEASPLATSANGQEDDRITVAHALGELSAMQRAVGVLHHLDGIDVGEVARTLRVRLGTVKTHLFRSRQHLAHALAEDPTSV